MLQSGRISQGWWRRFLERQKDLSLRQGDSTAHVRMDAMNRETIDHYFSLLHDTLSTNGLLNKPAQIYNVDESGVPFKCNEDLQSAPRTNSAEVNDSECCVCFVSYDNDQSGGDWVACACGRWLHEDCADDSIVMETSGYAAIILLCLNHFCK